MAEKRSIFEEVGAETKPTTAPKGGMIDAKGRGDRMAVRAWLIVLFALVVLMIVVGGLTRLTDSGLSITEWNLVTGMLPPFNDEVWQDEFTKYQQLCEFTEQNYDMTLSEFKTIYWWEWGHRFLGRIVGLVWAAGFGFLYLTKRIPTGWTPRLLAVGALGALQGVIGWWMVYSGVEECRTDVSSLRLAVHLGLAFVILGVLTWYILSMSRSEAALMQGRRGREGRLFGLSTGLLHMTGIQILLGALVAGIDAGRTYNTWPLMADGLFPPSPFSLTPWYSNFYEDAGLVQFIHRMWAYLLFAFAIVVWRRGRGSPFAATRRAFDWVMVLMFGQIVIGIGTVLYSAPWQIAIIHQLIAVAVWVAILRARFQAGYPARESIKGATT